ncbi:MAG: hypothetical protein ACK5OX_14990 [Desertimonas sp.]
MTDQEPTGASTLVDDAPAEAAPTDPAETTPPTDAPLPPDASGGDLGARPRRWKVAGGEHPWVSARNIEIITTVIALVVTTFVMMSAVRLNPLRPAADLVFDDNTPTGGDMGAHVWGPAFLRDQLLPNLQLNGWSMDWYAGLPAYRFYMVVPALMIVGLDTFLPYGVAFKLVVVAGLVTLPLCCWAFGKLAGFRSPMPQLFAFAGMAFALQESYSIYGGNLKSTMAGEFSFSIALSLGILGLGLLAKAMQTGKYRSWAAIVLALAIVSHGIVAIYVALGALVIAVIHMDNVKRLRFGVALGAATVLLSLFWIGPFLGNHEFMTDMKYGGRPDGASDSFWDMFFPYTDPLDILVTGLAIIGFVASVARRHLAGAALGVIGLFTVALVYLTRDSLPVIGLLWNPRLLPLLYLVELLMAMVGLVEVAALIGNVIRDRRAGAVGGAGVGVAAFATGAVAVCLIFAFFFEVIPGGKRITEHGQTVYAWGPFHKIAHPDDDDAYQKAQGSGWARYNFQGYEGRPHYPEYYDVVESMTEIGETNGCGRALWENNKDNGNYGTTMALMLLPFWTDGCIGSMEGLFFEASGTTPYHFLTTAAMSESSSNPVRQLRYVNNDAAVGVRHLQDLGVRYTLVRTDAAKREARLQDDLELLDTVGPWEIYQVADSDIVVPLDVQPVVVEERPGDQRERHLELGTSWFQHPEDWDALPADDGPEAWQRITAEIDEARLVPDPNKCANEAADAAARNADAELRGESTTTAAPCDPDTRGHQVDVLLPGQPIEEVQLDAVTISDVEINQQDLSFTVDQVGVPVLVKVSYFPNWTVQGADGPYRVAPNFMVVVPTDTEVRLEYSRSGSDTMFYGATVVGIGLLVWFRRRGDVDLDDDEQRDLDDDPDDVLPHALTAAGSTEAPPADDETAAAPRPDPRLDAGSEPLGPPGPDDAWWGPSPARSPSDEVSAGDVSADDVSADDVSADDVSAGEPSTPEPSSDASPAVTERDDGPPIA